ncbi:MAG TPA: hypothetical protein DEA05_03655 [Rhodobacteraceae bacterium]|nr:hypothetical protein [Paracoccaceae bacterium]
MQDVMSILNGLRRPRLLIRAARHGAQEYDRTRHLQRILGYGTLPRHAEAVMRLVEMEGSVNAQRLRGEAGYSLTRHLDLLIALMGEARLLRATRPAPVQ